MSWFSCCISERTPRSFELKAGKFQLEKGSEKDDPSENLTASQLSVLYEALENAEIEQALLRVPLFSVLTHAELSVLIKSLCPIVVKSGEFIYRQGEEGDTFFVVFSGEVEKVIESSGKQGIIMGQPLGTGSYFGQLGLLNRDERRSCSMRARGVTELRYIRRSEFYGKVGDLEKLLQRDPAQWQQYQAYFR